MTSCNFCPFLFLFSFHLLSLICLSISPLLPTLSDIYNYYHTSIQYNNIKQCSSVVHNYFNTKIDYHNKFNVNSFCTL